MAEPRFAVDRMLGRLATWLRLLGYDASYAPHLRGEALLRQARSEGRILLTRDHRLAARAPGLTVHLVRFDGFRDQLRDVARTFSLRAGPALLTRCSRCNEPLRPAPRDTLAADVPPYVLATQVRFWRCPHCGRVYWPATHHGRICAELAALGLLDT